MRGTVVHSPATWTCTHIPSSMADLVCAVFSPFSIELPLGHPHSVKLPLEHPHSVIDGRSRVCCIFGCSDDAIAANDFDF